MRSLTATALICVALVGFAQAQTTLSTCQGNDGDAHNLFTSVYGEASLNNVPCSWTHQKMGKRYDGTMVTRHICEMNNGKQQSCNSNTGVTWDKPCKLNPPDNNFICCVIETKCQGSGLVEVGGSFVERAGSCVFPTHCSSAIAGYKASSTKSCSATSYRGELACCVPQTGAQPMVKCDKRYTALFDKITATLHEDTELTNYRLDNFLPFIAPIYSGMRDRKCLPNGDCSAANFIAFATFLLIDVTNTAPEIAFQPVLDALTVNPATTADQDIRQLLEHSAVQGQLTPEYFAKFLNILWTDKGLNLLQYNRATCADWVQISSLVGRQWKCNDRWAALIESFNCVPTLESNLKDCEDGRGVCSLDDSYTPNRYGQCESGDAFTTNRDCSATIKNAVCCKKVKPTTAATISFHNNEYYNVRVAIDPNVPESEELIATLKRTLTAASKKLYEATDYRAFIRSWRIILPSTWSTRMANAPRLPEEKPKEAEFYIKPDIEDPTWSTQSTMNTIQMGQCGSPGFGVHLTPKDVTSSGLSSSNFVKHFAFNRYGIFREFPRVEEFELMAKNEVFEHKIPRCSQGANSDVRYVYFYCNSTLDIQINAQNPNTQTGSLAWLPDYAPKQFNVDSVIHFCDGRKDCGSKRLHNAEMTNTHNKVCHRLPTFEVILQSQDFRLGTPPRQGIYIKPDIFIVYSGSNNQDNAATQQPGGQVTHPNGGVTFPLDGGNGIPTTYMVLVLDQSGSMIGTPMDNLHRAASQFVDLLDVNMQLAIVSFDHQSFVRSKFIIGTPEGKSALKQAILSVQPIGWTCIQSGVNDAVKLLEQTGVQGGQIILINDGFNNRCGPTDSYEPKPGWLEDAMPNVQRQQAMIHSVAITDEADPNLETAAAMTGGKSYLINDANEITEFISSMQSLMSEITARYDEKRVLIVTDEALVQPGGRKDVTIQLDNLLSRNTLVSIFYTEQHGSFSASIRSPMSNTEFECTDDPVFKKLSCSIRTVDDEPGNYQLKMVSGGDSTKEGKPVVYSAVATIDPRLESGPVEIDGHMYARQFYIGKGKPEGFVYWRDNKETKQVIIATVSHGRYAVLNAEVVAVIKKPTGEERKRVHLFDNGDVYEDDGWTYNGVDLYANDGVYTGAFSLDDQSLEAGRYSVTLKVTGSALSNTYYTRMLLLGIPKTSAFLANLAATNEYIEFSRELQVGVFTVGETTADRREAMSRRSAAVNTGDEGELPREQNGRKRRQVVEKENILESMPPSPVGDFRLANVKQTETGTRFYFTWLTSGHYGMQGTPSHYWLNATSNILDAQGRGKEIEVSPRVDGRRVESVKVYPEIEEESGVPKTASVFLKKSEWKAGEKVYFSVVVFGDEAYWSTPSMVLIDQIPEDLPQQCEERGSCKQQMARNVETRSFEAGKKSKSHDAAAEKKRNHGKYTAQANSGQKNSL